MNVYTRIVLVCCVNLLLVAANRKLQNITNDKFVEPFKLEEGTFVGYWWWTWGDSKSAPSGTNAGIAFSGEVKVDSALSESSSIKSKLPGTKYISLGGGDSDGRFTASRVNSITTAINDGTFAGYGGIVYDIEEGDSGLSSVFKSSFKAAKASGLKVLVTVSNTAPYGISDAGALMRSFFSDSNIDYLSPQLYESGEETKNDYSTNGGVQWTEYGAAKAAVVPSIVKADLYPSAQSFLAGKGVTTKGYVQWKQV